MSKRRFSTAFLVLGVPLFVGCGGDTTSGNIFSNRDAGDSGTSGGASGASGSGSGGLASSSGGAGGASASGGSSGSTGTGGTIGSGGGSASGGSSGTGGAADAGACAPPTTPTDRALCVTFSPEAITARADPALDKRGVLIAQLFDTPNPPKENADQVALSTKLLPSDGATGGEISIDALPEVRFEGVFPATVYLRVFFVDNAKVLAKGSAGLDYGVWLGGIDLSGGIKDALPVSPVLLTAGATKSLDVPLIAFRRLEVVAHAGVKPIGDGQGKLTVVVVNNADPTKKPPSFGTATKKCADVTQGDVSLTGLFYGDGPYWVAGVLNDLGGPGDLPPGALATLDVTGNTARFPTKLVFGAMDYATSVMIDLNYAVPLPADAAAPGPNSCADLGLGADAGP